MHIVTKTTPIKTIIGRCCIKNAGSSLTCFSGLIILLGFTRVITVIYSSGACTHVHAYIPL